MASDCAPVGMGEVVRRSVDASSVAAPGLRILRRNGSRGWGHREELGGREGTTSVSLLRIGAADSEVGTEGY